MLSGNGQGKLKLSGNVNVCKPLPRGRCGALRGSTRVGLRPRGQGWATCPLQGLTFVAISAQLELFYPLYNPA